MKDYVFKSNFKSDISNFLNLKHSLGYKYYNGQILLEQFDTFCFNNFQSEISLTKEIGLAWATLRKNESCSSVQNRIVVIREFAKYLNGIDKIAFVIPTTYIPKQQKYKSYIYSKLEIQKIFDILDNKKYNCRNENMYIVLPVLFRILYCCGLRISEIASLRVEHFDIDNGMFSVYESKNNNNRLIPISDKLKNICIGYFIKMHSNSSSDDFFFYTNERNIPISKGSIRGAFKRILKVANIEKSKLNNPRIHDFRHTFAVNCLKKFVQEDKNLDAYLPILKTYMGHSKFISTEYYLKLTNDMFPKILEKANLYIGDAIPRIGGAYEK